MHLIHSIFIFCWACVFIFFFSVLLSFIKNGRFLFSSCKANSLTLSEWSFVTVSEASSCYSRASISGFSRASLSCSNSTYGSLTHSCNCHTFLSSCSTVSCSKWLCWIYRSHELCCFFIPLPQTSVLFLNGPKSRPHRYRILYFRTLFWMFAWFDSTWAVFPAIASISRSIFVLTRWVLRFPLSRPAF